MTMTAGTIRCRPCAEASLSSAAPCASSRRPVRRGLAVPAFAAAGLGRSETGPGWSASTPNVRARRSLRWLRVTCVTVSDCWAVGDRFRSSSSDAGPALIEHYVSGKWTIRLRQPRPNRARWTSSPGSAACQPRTVGRWVCAAVRTRGNLLEHYGTHGTWRSSNTPAPQGELYAVACEAAIGAVLGSRIVKRRPTLHLRSGSWAASWRYVRPSPLSASFVQASGVACREPKTTACSSGTPRRNTVPARPLAERWNGRGWSAVTVAGELSGGGSLAGVDCLQGSSPVTCWAVGQTVTKGFGPDRDASPGRALGRELVRHRSTVQREAPVITPSSEAVACAAVTACQAVGSRGSGEDEALVLTEGWNGSSWSAETSPSPLYGFQSLTGVACPSGEGMLGRRRRLEPQRVGKPHDHRALHRAPPDRPFLGPAGQ